MVSRKIMAQMLLLMSFRALDPR